MTGYHVTVKKSGQGNTDIMLVNKRQNVEPQNKMDINGEVRRKNTPNKYTHTCMCVYVCVCVCVRERERERERETGVTDRDGSRVQSLLWWL